jgi:hypothetical protein
MANIYEKCPTLEIIREMQIKPKRYIPFIPVRMTITKKTKDYKC